LFATAALALASGAAFAQFGPLPPNSTSTVTIAPAAAPPAPELVIIEPAPEPVYGPLVILEPAPAPVYGALVILEPAPAPGPDNGLLKRKEVNRNDRLCDESAHPGQRLPSECLTHAGTGAAAVNDFQGQSGQ
jgi:hypothetical protein